MRFGRARLASPLLVASLTLGLGLAACGSEGDGTSGTGQDAVSETQEQAQAELEGRLEEVQKRVDKKIEQLRETAGRPEN